MVNVIFPCFRTEHKPHHEWTALEEKMKKAHKTRVVAMSLIIWSRIKQSLEFDYWSEGLELAPTKLLLLHQQDELGYFGLAEWQ